MAHKKDGNWKVPEWMQPYVDKFFPGWGNASVEDFYNDNHTTTFENAPRALQCVAIKSKIDVLIGLYEAGMLSENAFNDKNK